MILNMCKIFFSSIHIDRYLDQGLYISGGFGFALSIYKNLNKEEWILIIKKEKKIIMAGYPVGIIRLRLMIYSLWKCAWIVPNTFS